MEQHLTDRMTNQMSRVALGDMLRRVAHRRPEKAALIEGGRHVSFAQFNDDACRFSHFLLSRGLKRGDKVAMLCNNSAEMVIATFGIFKAGMVWVPINTMLGEHDLRYIAQHSDARLLVIDAALHALPVPQTLVKSLKLEAITLGQSGVEGAECLSDVLHGWPATEPDVVIDGGDLAAILYTSGTTSRPKGVMHSHQAIYIATCVNCIELDVGSHDISCAVLPIFHCAQFSGVLTSMVSGGTLVILNGFDPGNVLATIERERVNRITMLPMMYAALLAHPDRIKRDLSSLTACVYGMAPMAKPLLAELTTKICPTFILGSGQTEMFPCTVTFRPAQHPACEGNYWGESSVLNDTAIMDDNGNLVPPGTVGEIVHRGPNVMLGYYKDAEATAASRTFGWHQTGDLGMIGVDQQLRFLDRKKDMIKSGGENVASVKVEEALLGHPMVANAAVVGLPHPRWEEAVVGFVVLKPGGATQVDELIAHCHQHLAGFEVPKAILIHADMPLTATGKVKKQELKAAHTDYFARL